MDQFALSSEPELERARRDPEYRHRLVSQNLDMLLAALNKLRSANASGKRESAQMKEGAQLAVLLSDILHRLAEQRGPVASVEND